MTDRFELPTEGRPVDAIFAELDAYRSDDMAVSGGRAWTYVYDAGPEVAALQKRAVAAFMSKNGLDPTAFPSLGRLENEVIGASLSHLNAPASGVGTFTSGGTESCMLAVLTARERAKAERGITAPEMLLPESAHAAFHKGAKYFGIKPILVKLDPETFEVDLDDLRSKITDNTVLLVGSAPGYAHGVVDPIEALGAIGLEHDIPVHVDGCIGAWLLPLLEALGEPVPAFDFRVPGVTSISMDLHKYAFAPKGSSVLLMRDAAYRRHQLFACSHWSGYGVVNTTMQSTKSGGPLAGAWAVMQHLGRDGYLALAKKMSVATRELLEGIEAIDDLRVLGTPVMGLIAIASDTVDVFALSDALERKGWRILPQLSFGESPKNLHLMVEPGNAPHAQAFLADLREATAHVRANPPKPLPAMLDQVASMLTPEMVRAKYTELLGMLGGGSEKSDGLPEERAELNAVIDKLAPETREALLIEFMNHFYVASAQQRKPVE